MPSNSLDYIGLAISMDYRGRRNQKKSIQSNGLYGPCATSMDSTGRSILSTCFPFVFSFILLMIKLVSVGVYSEMLIFDIR